MASLALRCFVFASTAALALAAGAQVSAPPAPQVVAEGQAQPVGPTGSVTGTVFVQDTQRPARFADVILQNVTSASGQTDRFGSGGGFGGGLQARTEADGSFTLTGVAPGDYYVTAGGLGYIPQRALLQAAVAAGADPNELLARIPVVHVVADSTSTINVAVQHGGTLAGRLVWEDGSPAAGIPVSAVSSVPVPALPTSLQGIRSLGNASNSVLTDDRGMFRIAGMAAGDYLLQATIQSRGQFGGFGGRGQQMVSTIRIYSPGTFHRASAKPVTVRVGEERDDLRMTIDLRGLHTVAGHASAASGATNVASGRVTLTDSTDSSLQLGGLIQPDGTFSVRFVPPGSYTLQINGASSQANSGYGGRGRGGSSSSSGTSFQPFSAAVTVTDVDLTGVAAMLTPVQGTP